MSIILAAQGAGIDIELKSMLKSGGYDPVFVCESGGEVLRTAVSLDEPSLIICTAQLGDMPAMEIARYLTPYHKMIILLSSFQNASSIYEYGNNQNTNVLTLLLPLNRTDLIKTAELMTRTADISPGKKPPRRSKEENELIEKAKAILIDRNGMTEQQAHRFIQQKSMDTCLKMAEIAFQIAGG